MRAQRVCKVIAVVLNIYKTIGLLPRLLFNLDSWTVWPVLHMRQRFLLSALVFVISIWVWLPTVIFKINARTVLQNSDVHISVALYHPRFYKSWAARASLITHLHSLQSSNQGHLVFWGLPWYFPATFSLVFLLAFFHLIWCGIFFSAFFSSVVIYKWHVRLILVISISLNMSRSLQTRRSSIALLILYTPFSNTGLYHLLDFFHSHLSHRVFFSFC